MKQCVECNEIKSLESFAWRRKASGIRQSRCRQCMSKRMRAARYELNSKYGITPQQYEDMLKKQKGCCALCFEPEKLSHNGKVIRLAVDHDRSCCPSHRKTCGKCIRALLCSDCNRLVGRLEANPELTARALEYVKIAQASPKPE